MLRESGKQRVPLRKLQTNAGKELLATADVVIAVDTRSDAEDVVYGEWDWNLAVSAGQEAELAVLRVELNMNEELDTLSEIVKVSRGPEDDAAAER
jgi:hypothetical protein